MFGISTGRVAYRGGSQAMNDLMSGAPIATAPECVVELLLEAGRSLSA